MKLYKRLSVILSMGIMGIGLITFSTAPGRVQGTEGIVPEKSITTEEDDNRALELTLIPELTEEPDEEPTPTEIAEELPSPTPAPNYLKRNSNTKITELVNDYLQAKLTCTREAFEDIVTDASYVNIDMLAIQTETVLSYELLDCYTKRGYGPVDYVVYYTYNMNIATLTTPVLAMDSLYVTVDDNGNYRVFVGVIDNAVQEQLDALDEEADVQSVLTDINAKIQKAMDEDETLTQYWARMYEKLKVYFDNQKSEESQDSHDE